MEQVTAYKALTGEIFQTAQECLEWESLTYRSRKTPQVIEAITEPMMTEQIPSTYAPSVANVIINSWPALAQLLTEQVVAGAQE